MARSGRSSVNGVSRSGRAIRSIVISDTPSPSASPEPASLSSTKYSKRNRRQSLKTSMRKSSPQVEVQTHQAEAERANVRSSIHSEPLHAMSAADDKMEVDSSDEVEEYIFSSEEEFDNDDNDMDDTRSHISLSSDDPPLDYHPIESRPWRQMTNQQRSQYEGMFVSVTSPAVGQSWSYTEDYQLQIDNLLLMYMQDYPLPNWIIGREAAERAYHHYRERSRWRMLGIRIYGAEKIPDIFRPHVSFPAAATAAQPPAMQPMPQHPVAYEVIYPLQQEYNAPTTQHPRPYHVGTTPGQKTASSVPVMPPSGPVPPANLPHQPSAPRQSSAPRKSSTPRRSNTPRQSTEPQSHPINAQPTQSHAHAHPPRPRPHQAKGSGKAAIKKAKEAESATPPPRPMTPPYPARDRPPERKPLNKTGKRPARKPAEAEVFPWNREIDYRAETENATWDMEIYDPKTLATMEKVREHNDPIIERLDHEVVEKQRIARNNKKARAAEGTVESPARPGRKKKDPNDKSDNNDPYHAGYFEFANDEMKERAEELGYRSPDWVIRAGEDGKLTNDELESIKICWNPGRKGLAYDLVQATFSARDTVLTRKQLATTKILTRDAAMSIIDFSPNLLWREILLRICSEAGCGNKDVRDRFCLNGCHADKATFTKRISSALGQKQTQAKTKGYETGEWEFYEASGEDFKNYIEFFGKRMTTRNMKIGLKRRLGSMAAEGSGAEDESIEKRAKSGDESGDTTLSVVQSDDVAMDDADAVSLQDSDALDEMSD